VLPGEYSGNSSCDLKISQNDIIIQGVSDANGKPPRIDCSSDGPMRFVLVLGHGLQISNLRVANCTVTDGSYVSDGLFGAGIVAHGSTSSVYASDLVFEKCRNGVIHASEGGTVELERSKLLSNLGTAAIATYGSSLILRETEINGATDLTPSATSMWKSLCGTVNGTCTVQPPPYTLCEEVGMNRTGNFPSPYFGGYVTKCAGSTPERCVVRQDLDNKVTIAGKSDFQAPGGDFGRTCKGYCGAFGLSCFFGWPAYQKSCHVETLISTTECLVQVKEGGGNNENVCICVRPDSPSAQFGAGVRTMLRSTSVLINTRISKCKSDSVQVESKSSSNMTGVTLTSGEGRGIAIDKGTRANIITTTIQSHTGVGIDVLGDLNADGADVRSNIGGGIVVKNAATAALVRSNILSNGAYGVAISSQGNVKMLECAVSKNSQGGVSVTGNGKLRLDESRVWSNIGTGVSVSGANVTAYNTAVYANNAGLRTSGGGWRITSFGSTEITGGQIYGNKAGADGGGIFLDATNGASLALRGGVRFWENEAQGWGGGLRAQNVYPMVESTKTPWRFNCLATNGTHMFVHGKDNNIYYSHNMATRAMKVLAGSGDKGAQDGTMNGTDKSTQPSFNLNGGTIATDNANKYLYVAEAGTHLVRRIGLLDGETKSIAGKFYTSLPKPLISARDTPGTFFGPWGIVVSKDDAMLYVSDSVGYLPPTGFGGAIYSISTTTYEVKVIAGGNAYGHKDGPVDTAQFMNPWSMALDMDANKLYVADVNDRTVRVVHLNQGVVTTLAGLPGVTAYADGPANEAAFVYKYAMVVSADGSKLYVAEDFRVRQVCVRQYMYICMSLPHACNNTYIHTYIHTYTHIL
jgi:hypothetical protein